MWLVCVYGHVCVYMCVCRHYWKACLAPCYYLYPVCEEDGNKNGVLHSIDEWADSHSIHTAKYKYQASQMKMSQPATVFSSCHSPVILPHYPLSLAAQHVCAQCNAGTF